MPWTNSTSGACRGRRPSLLWCRLPLIMTPISAPRAPYTILVSRDEIKSIDVLCFITLSHLGFVLVLSKVYVSPTDFWNPKPKLQSKQIEFYKPKRSDLSQILEPKTELLSQERSDWCAHAISCWSVIWLPTFARGNYENRWWSGDGEDEVKAVGTGGCLFSEALFLLIKKLPRILVHTTHTHIERESKLTALPWSFIFFSPLQFVKRFCCVGDISSGSVFFFLSKTSSYDWSCIPCQHCFRGNPPRFSFPDFSFFVISGVCPSTFCFWLYG